MRKHEKTKEQCIAPGANETKGCSRCADPLQPPPPTHQQQQAAGVSAMAGACFAMVAGGLGERLGYNGIKVFEFPKPRHYDLLGLLGL